MRMFVASGDGIVVMTNGDNGSALTREIERAAACVYGWPDKPAVKKAAVVSAANLARLAGSYQLQDLDFRVAVKDGGLVISSPMQLEPVEFLPESDTEFFPTADGLGKMKFHFTPEGKVEAFEIFGQRARRVEPRLVPIPPPKRPFLAILKLVDLTHQSSLKEADDE